jgi:Ca-activated chloride channel family protein
MTAPSLVLSLLKHSSTIARFGAVLASAAVVVSGSLASGGAQFSSGVNLVEVFATVTDQGGEVIRGLTREDFEVFEDSQRQEISAFAAGDFPLSVALALDRSFSMAGERLTAAKSAGRAFLDALRAEDQAVVLAIGSTVDVVAPLSLDRAAQQAALFALDAFGTTGLYDAVIRAIELTAPGRGRRVLILLSDGADRYSRATAEAALAAARGNDVMIYPVALGRERPSVFAELAAVSGGRSFHVRDPRQLGTTLAAIATDLRHQYLIGYTPARPLAGGAREWRSIQVKVRRPGVRVRARDGYLG